ncbi:MAG: PfkB family carbohydrate kinase [Ignavibacteriaceae bacterium]
MPAVTAIGEILFDVYPTSKALGGAPINFLFHIFKLTGQGTIVSRVGHDVLGEKVRRFLTNSGILTNYIQDDHNHPTGITNVTLDEQKVPTFNIDTDGAYDFIENTSELQTLIDNETDCLYFGSLAQRNDVSRNTIQSLFGKNIKYFCDLNIRQYFYSEDILICSIKSADVLKVNIDELKLLHNLLIGNEFDMMQSSFELMGKYKIDLIAVTKGAAGSTLIRDNKADHYQIEAKEVVDTLGAGDAFASILCIGYLQGWELSLINKTANEFAGEICKIKGALPGDDFLYEKYKKKLSDE